MWTPTHVKVTVHKARNLKVKGRSGSDDTYAVVCLDDEKFTTSVKTRNKSPEWNESYDMPVPSDVSSSVLRVTVLHRNLFAFDDLLGEAYIALEQFSIYERPQSRWYSLSNVRGSKKDNGCGGGGESGEVQVMVTFMVRSRVASTDSSGTLERQKSPSFRSLANIVGKKLGGRRSSISDLRENSLADMTERKFPLHSAVDMHDVSESFHRIQLSSSSSSSASSSDDDVFSKRQRKPKLIYEEDAEATFPSDSDFYQKETKVNNEEETDDHVTAVAKETLRRRPARQMSLHTLMEERETVEFVNNARNLQDELLPDEIPVYAEDYINRTNQYKRHSIIGCGETLSVVATSFQPKEFQEDNEAERNASTAQIGSDKTDFEGFDRYNRDELIKLVLEQRAWMQSKTLYVQDLESYIDALLIRVLETNQQSILENPYNEPSSKTKKSTKSDDNKKKLVVKTKKTHLIDLIKIWKD